MLSGRRSSRRLVQVHVSSQATARFMFDVVELFFSKFSRVILLIFYFLFDLLSSAVHTLVGRPEGRTIVSVIMMHTATLSTFGRSIHAHTQSVHIPTSMSREFQMVAIVFAGIRPTGRVQFTSASSTTSNSLESKKKKLAKQKKVAGDKPLKIPMPGSWTE
ncbi:hypothetical protein P152DRAFT_289822 [Eremomyces bilateralis CBS 781.70]|uniref:Uncharacterized protein n=1 Tax=Eremomyces bilateralis CBS 781.70 TaxID=1392243 RepID=A0A6G1G755_9PEZI|nr:uncharacterized protein P152DRAFT_289822 [Eremomyces bilateralis CBS 781.70]KAF1813730.1 hypothetical protein P152DRAFT_289822 [Eremomyces bilateralis CBS 781.70]